MSAKRIAVIGAGASGLPAIKACKDDGLDVVCYEMTDYVGGLWKFRDEDVEGLASVMRSTIINSSKEISAFSDYPPPKEFPNYMHNTYCHKYLVNYAKEFALEDFIKFKHKVETLEPTDDNATTGRWRMTVKNLLTDEVFTEEFDGVMVCNGHHVYPSTPSFAGLDEFEGTVMHSHSYKKAETFADKRVLVVGVGNSGGDAAVELSFISKQVYLSTRRGCWIIQRVGPNGEPYDLTFIKRSMNTLFELLPYNLVCSVAEYKQNRIFDHETYKLKPKHRIFGQHPMVNDTLPSRILSGTVAVKANIKRFTKNGVIFEGEDKEYPIDGCLMCTGYNVKFPFLSEEILPVENNKVDLFKYVFSPKYPTLAIIGLVQPVGPLFPISEIQSRWFTSLMVGRVKLPSQEEMWNDINANHKWLQRFFEGPRNTLELDWLPYMDSIATFIDAKPNMSRLLLTDPKLFYHCLCGPAVPYQYRLQGPNPWKGARNAVLTVQDRVHSAFDTKKLPNSGQDQMNTVKFLFGVMFIVSLAYILAVVF